MRVLTARWTPVVMGLLAVMLLVILPIELRIGLAESPVVAPSRVVSLLIIGSCLLLVWSGVGLRRLEAARVLAQRQTPSA